MIKLDAALRSTAKRLNSAALTIEHDALMSSRLS
jgi:hypothetical protein